MSAAVDHGIDNSPATSRLCSAMLVTVFAGGVLAVSADVAEMRWGAARAAREPSCVSLRLPSCASSCVDA